MTSRGANTNQKGKGALEDVADAAEEAYRATKTTIKTAYVDGTAKCKKALHLTSEAGSSSSEAAPNVRSIIPPKVVTNNTPRAGNYAAILPGSPPKANATNADETTPLVGGANRSSAADGSTKSSQDDVPKRQPSIMVGEISDEEEPMPPDDDVKFLRFTPELCRLSIIFVVGTISSIQSSDMIRSDGIVPLHLAVLWTILGVLAGHLLWPVMHKAEIRDEVASLGTAFAAEEGGKGPNRSRSPQKSPLNKSISRVSFNEERQGAATSRPPTYIERKRDYVFQLFRGVSSYLVTPGSVEPARSRPTLTPMSSLADIPGDIWTTLGDATRRTKAYWEEHVYDKPTGALMQRLLKYDDFRTKPCSSSDYSYQESDSDAHSSIPGEQDVTEDVYAARMKTERLGHVNTGNNRASILQANIEVEPLFKLRGMDVFRADIPEERIWRQPILEQNGLRDVPTFIVNLMLPGANLVVYFQMPTWIKKFEEIVEEEDDAEDTKAFKRFLRGTDQYRNKRWKVLPCLVDGPYIIKAMGLPQKEVTIAGGRVGATWHEYDESIDAHTGKKRAALLAVDCDMIGNPGVRKICNIVLGQVKNVRIDCAMIVEKPYLSEAEEPAACLGLWRMDRVDMSKAALVPEKDEEQLLHEMSVLLNADDLVGLKDDLEGEENVVA